MIQIIIGNEVLLGFVKACLLLSGAERCEGTGRHWVVFIHLLSFSQLIPTTLPNHNPIARCGQSREHQRLWRCLFWWHLPRCRAAAHSCRGATTSSRSLVPSSTSTPPLLRLRTSMATTFFSPRLLARLVPARFGSLFSASFFCYGCVR